MIKDRAQPECSGLFVADDCNIIGVSVFVEQEGIQFHDRAEISSKILKPRNFFNEVDRILDLRFDSPHLSYGLGKPYTLVDLTTPENQQRDGLLTLFEALTDAMESDAFYYADATFGTKTYPLVLSSALHYAEKILDDTEVCGIYYRELTRESGQVKNARQYDISTLFTLDGIVDMAAGEDIADKRAFIKLMLHPDREV
mgnify:CR=1 FL=1